ncbi:hypothetical protein LSPH24S_04932 [Lysinibacillus sphaericus]
MEEIHLIFARNLKAIREKEKLSLEKVSQLCGVSKTMIGQIERGESSPTLTTIWNELPTGLKVPPLRELAYLISMSEVQLHERLSCADKRD